MKINPNFKPSQIKKDVLRKIEINAIMEANKALYKEQDEIDNRLATVFIRERGGKLVITTMLKIGRNVVRFIPKFKDAKKGVIKTTTWKASAQRSFDVTID